MSQAYPEAYPSTPSGTVQGVGGGGVGGGGVGGRGVGGGGGIF